MNDIKWWEIKTDDNSTPGRPEDNTVIIAAHTLSGAIDMFDKNRGKMLLKGTPVSCKQIYYVLILDTKP